MSSHPVTEVQFRTMVPRRMGGHEIQFAPPYKRQSRRCRAIWTDAYGRLDVFMSIRDWGELQALESAASQHVYKTLAVEGAEAHSYVKAEDEDEEDGADGDGGGGIAVVRLKVTAKTDIFDWEGTQQDSMPPAGTAMDVRVLVESCKLWLREGRFGLELRLNQVKWYPRTPPAAIPTAVVPKASVVAGKRSHGTMQFLDDPEAPE